MARYKILIVEDEGVISMHLETLLRKWGYETLATSFGEKVLDIVAEECPALALMDIRLAGAMDGVEAATQLHEQFDVPVIYLTAYTDEHLLKRTQKTEPYGYLVKPVHDLELRAMLNIALSKRALECQLREREAQYRALVETSPDAISLTDLEGNFVAVNARFLELYGFDSLADIQAQGLTAFDLIASDFAKLSEHQQHVRDSLQQALEQNVVRNITYLTKRKDGSPFYTEMSVSIIRDENGEPVNFMAVNRDITERQQAEADLALYAAKLERSNRELEQFAYVVSHDLQEPLRMVTSFLNLLQRRVSEQLDDKAQEYIAYATDGAERMHSMIKALLAYARIGTQGKPFKPTDCEALLASVLRSVQFKIEDVGAVVTHDPLPTVIADGMQLERVFQNLVSNALKFQPRADEGLDPPRIHISAERTCEAGGSSSVQRQDRWLFKVQDNGIGIDPEYFPHLFQVFRRLHTRDEYEGTGIGLANCRKIVERHGGRIWVESEPGVGSTFYFTLPVEVSPPNEEE